MLDRNWLESFMDFDFQADCRERTPLVTLDSNDAYELGNLAKEIVKETLVSHREARERLEYLAAVDVSTADGHCLFRSAVSPGTSTINDWSIVENRKAAISYRCSSYVLQEELDRRENINSGSRPKHVAAKSSGSPYYGGAVPIL
ncbi:hypothetical protein BZL39_K04190 [Zygosaccharomyces parabailii]|nr:hypothetical protein BZL39_K04190 [Zygosaccharomyces parabailii]CDH11861.1 uncharacterized protein ZBAI_03647 [Zygosaccharomyces bailii ISA1307]